MAAGAILAAFRIGYTGRRPGEAEPARVVEGETQNLVIRVRGKWFSSGDVGRKGKLSDRLLFVSHHSAPGVPVRHRRMAVSVTWRPRVVIDPGRGAQVEDDASLRPRE